MNTPRTRITWLNSVLDNEGRKIGTLLCGPNRDGTYTIRTSEGVSNVPGSTIAIALTSKGEYVNGETVRSSVFQGERPCK